MPRHRKPSSSSMKNDENSNNSSVDAANAELLALSRARNALRADANRVSDTLRELVASDERFIEHSKKNTEEYDQKLNTANKRLAAIAKRERLDNQILWWSFTIFFFAVAWIWKQRLIGFGFW